MTAQTARRELAAAKKAHAAAIEACDKAYFALNPADPVTDVIFRAAYGRLTAATVALREANYRLGM